MAGKRRRSGSADSLEETSRAEAVKGVRQSGAYQSLERMFDYESYVFEQFVRDNVGRILDGNEEHKTAVVGQSPYGHCLAESPAD